MQVLQSVVARFAHAAHLNSELKGTIKYVIEPFQFLNRRIHHGLADSFIRGVDLIQMAAGDTTACSTPSCRAVRYWMT